MHSSKKDRDLPESGEIFQAADLLQNNLGANMHIPCTYDIRCFTYQQILRQLHDEMGMHITSEQLPHLCMHLHAYALP